CLTGMTPMMDNRIRSTSERLEVPGTAPTTAPNRAPRRDHRCVISYDGQRVDLVHAIANRNPYAKPMTNRDHLDVALGTQLATISLTTRLTSGIRRVLCE